MIFGFQPDLAAIQIISLLRWCLIIAVAIAFIKFLFESVGKAILVLILGLIAFVLLDPGTIPNTGSDILNFFTSGSEFINNIELSEPINNP